MLLLFGLFVLRKKAGGDNGLGYLQRSHTAHDTKTRLMVDILPCPLRKGEILDVPLHDIWRGVGPDRMLQSAGQYALHAKVHSVVVGT